MREARAPRSSGRVSGSLSAAIAADTTIIAHTAPNRSSVLHNGVIPPVPAGGGFFRLLARRRDRYSGPAGISAPNGIWATTRTAGISPERNGSSSPTSSTASRPPTAPSARPTSSGRRALSTRTPTTTELGSGPASHWPISGARRLLPHLRRHRPGLPRRPRRHRQHRPCRLPARPPRHRRPALRDLITKTSRTQRRVLYQIQARPGRLHTCRDHVKATALNC